MRRSRGASAFFMLSRNGTPPSRGALRTVNDPAASSTGRAALQGDRPMGEAFRTDRFAATAAPETMAAWVMRSGPVPDPPLSLRVAALDYLMRRQGCDAADRTR